MELKKVISVKRTILIDRKNYLIYPDENNIIET